MQTRQCVSISLATTTLVSSIFNTPAMQDILLFLNCLLNLVCSFSTGLTSVHGESPSAEYAKLRKESLESEFGHALGANRSKSFSAAYRFGPFLALYRAAIISFHVLKLTIWQFCVQDIRKRAIKVFFFPFCCICFFN